MHAWSDPTARLARLREIFEIAAAGESDRDRFGELLPLAGQLFDEGNLDGAQYAAVADLAAALETGDSVRVPACSRECLGLIA